MSNVPTKPASGMRDFLPVEAKRRKRVFAIIEEVYQSYGFEPLETPTMERLSTLMGKYGEEGDQLLFKVMQRGDKLQKALAKPNPSDTDLADMGLRYDLTVPLARVVAQYRNDLPRYFKRYQIAPVWRADRPQKGRYREFYQCDVDIVGSTSMTVEAEVTSALSEVLHRLGFGGFRIHVNHRKLLTAIMEFAHIAENQRSDALIALDKFDKIGRDGVTKELHERGIDSAAVNELLSVMNIAWEGCLSVNGNANILERLRQKLGAFKSGQIALDELEELLLYAAQAPAGRHLVIDPSLARGLSYYTGPIFEIRSDDFSGSLGGGGRYDELLGMFTKESLPACGFSLGIERILMLMEERGLFADEQSSVDVLISLWDRALIPHSIALASMLRSHGLKVDVYADTDKYGKQFKYADQRGIRFVLIAGPKEVENNQVSIKDLRSGNQSTLNQNELATWLNDNLHN